MARSQLALAAGRLVRQMGLPVILLAVVTAVLSCRPRVGVATAADRHELTLTVSAGEFARVETPVRVPLVIPAEFAKSTPILLADDGRVIIGQLATPSCIAPKPAIKPGQTTRDLHFVLPKLKAGEDMEIELVLPKQAPAKSVPQFAWKDTAGKFAQLSFDGRPTLKYMYQPLDESSAERRAETYKVFHHLYDPTGKRLVTKGPGGLFPHHRGLFFGFNRISYGGKQADIWHCRAGESQQHERFLTVESGPVLGRHRVAVAWHGRDGKPFAREQREMGVYATEAGLLVEFASKLTSLVGPVKLDGDPQHAGFQFRASQDVPDKTRKQTYYLRPDGRDKPGSYRNWSGKKGKPGFHVNLPWNAMSIVLDGSRYTCCYLDRPQNPKEARFSERDYGRFGSYFEYELDKDKPLLLNYRIWFQAGEMTVDQVASLSHDFVDPVKVRIEER